MDTFCHAGPNYMGHRDNLTTTGYVESALTDCIIGIHETSTQYKDLAGFGESSRRQLNANFQSVATNSTDCSPASIMPPCTVALSIPIQPVFSVPASGIALGLQAPASQVAANLAVSPAVSTSTCQSCLLSYGLSRTCPPLETGRIIYPDPLVRYDPYLLDDPEMMVAAKKRVLNLPFYLSSVIIYMRPNEHRRNVNREFFERFPNIQLTLTKLRSLKMTIVQIVH
ncbi:unnamed protein product, partial [Protopolystoma xenopodis]